MTRQGTGRMFRRVQCRIVPVHVRRPLYDRLRNGCHARGRRGLLPCLSIRFSYSTCLESESNGLGLETSVTEAQLPGLSSPRFLTPFCTRSAVHKCEKTRRIRAYGMRSPVTSSEAFLAPDSHALADAPGSSLFTAGRICSTSVCGALPERTLTLPAQL